MTSPGIRIAQQLSSASFTDGTPGTITTGLVGPGATDAQVLEAVAVVISQGLPAVDTGWASLSGFVAAGVTEVVNSYFAGLNYRVRNGVATLTGAATKASWAAGDVICSLPAQLTPSIAIYGAGDVVVAADATVRTLDATTGLVAFTVSYPV